MKRALAVIVGVAVVCIVGYLSWLNPTAVTFHWSPTRSVDAPLAALIIFAFVVGVLAVLSVVLMQAGRRAVTTWRTGRQQRRTERIDTWADQGEQLLWQGDVQQGRSLLHKAWRRRPEDARAVLALAASFRETGEGQRARLALEEAARHHHTHPGVLLALADAHRAVGDQGASLEALERLRALHPRAPRVLQTLRDRYVEAERWAHAAAVQETLLGELRQPDDTERERQYLTVLRHQAALQLGDPAARVHALEALTERRSVSVPIAVSLGDSLLEDGRRDEAWAVWERALRSIPRTVLVERLAAIATEPQHRDRLRSVLQKLRPDQVQFDNVRLLSAGLHLVDGNTDAAGLQLDAVHAPATAPALLHRLWGDLHRQRGQLELAVAAYARGHGKHRGDRCTVCQRAAADWVAWCPACRSWDSYRSDVEIGAP
jgi:tetratricopeptide (TPR) repeat protein